MHRPATTALFVLLAATLSATPASADSLTRNGVVYRLRGADPIFNARLDDVVVAGDVLAVEVDPGGPAKRVHAYVPGVPGARAIFAHDPISGRYHGELEIPEDLLKGSIVVRVVVRDGRGNRFVRAFHIDVIPLIDCCADSEFEGDYC